ncbi:uncharacterized protein V1510DRAFT_401012 [Dipodascopsis tothii]|uniref:uncharacterized protein n=1 Tax=Dipodascopsis tothii TaxID=44089 RepID=UPI0034D004E0
MDVATGAVSAATRVGAEAAARTASAPATSGARTRLDENDASGVRARGPLLAAPVAQVAGGRGLVPTAVVVTCEDSSAEPSPAPEGLTLGGYFDYAPYARGPPSSSTSSSPERSERYERARARRREPEVSYADTARWGYIILATTWAIFVGGMGSMLGVWRWVAPDRPSPATGPCPTTTRPRRSCWPSSRGCGVWRRGSA